MQVPDIPLENVLPLCGRVLHKGRSVAQADVYPLKFENQDALLKTFHARPWLVRMLWARSVCGREVRMLRRLIGVPDVPQLLATVGREGFIMTRLPARRLPRRKEPPPQPEFWKRARRLIHAMHARGIAHGDLRRKNLLMDEAASEPFLIDFATAVAAPAKGARPSLNGWLKRFLFKRCVAVDRITFVRIKRAYRARLTRRERAWLADEPLFLKIGRFFKRLTRIRKMRHWRNWAHRRNKTTAEARGLPRPKKRRKPQRPSKP